ncbi:unnamed protein product [Scytosiphon promiscuus]
MDVEQDVRSEKGQGGGGGGGRGGPGSGPINARRASPPSGNLEGGAGAGGGRPRQERDELHPAGKARSASGDRVRLPTLGKKNPLRKENRMWNLKHMRATHEGKSDPCAYCRVYPDGALMVCSSPELVKMHSFCFQCLKEKDGIEKSDIIGGGIKWDCPSCLERRSRPKRGAPPPSSLRGKAWAGGGVLTSPAAMPHTAGVPHASGAGGRSRDPDRGATAGGGHAGLKRSASSAEVGGRLVWAVLSSSSGPNEAPVGGHSCGKYLSMMQEDSCARECVGWPCSLSLVRGTLNFVEGAASAQEPSRSCPEPQSSLRSKRLACVSTRAHGQSSRDFFATMSYLTLSIKQPIERRRLMRMVATFALDRLQQLDPLNLFKDPVPAGVAGYAEAIEFPIDFSTIRRRSQWGLYGSIQDLSLDVQLLCANAKTFNAPGTIYHKEATNVQEGAERIWPQARELLNRLLSAEATAVQHDVRGPAASSDAWPLDGPFVGLELTPANEDAPAFLYTRGEMGEEESILRDSLSAYRSDCLEKALRRLVDCAKCEPITLETLRERQKLTRPLATPVTRRFVAPDGEFLAHEAADDQPPVPSGPNPKLGDVKREPPKTVVPEWRVLQAAHGAKQRSGEEAVRHMRTFRGFFKEVAAVSKTRLRVDKSAVQGLGVYTTQAIAAHELVAEYVGERVKLAEARKRLARYRRASVPQDFMVRVGEDPVFLDATRKGNIARFLNHSCDPNLYMLTVTAGKEHAQEKRVCFFSLRNIPKGEELCYSYPAPHTVGLGVAVAPACACRAPGCRGRMSKREDQL